MIIDFHTHFFPDAIVDKAMDRLMGGINFNNAIGGRKSDLIREMDLSGVTYSVNLPVLTNPKSFYSTLDKLLPDERIINFAGIHPLCDDLKGKIKEIKSRGFKGVKLHPMYQGTTLNSIENKKIVEYCEEEGLITVFHCGHDYCFKDSTDCSCDRVLDLYKDVKPKNVVLAHFGSLAFWEDVEKYLAGLDGYLDTAFTLDLIDKDLFNRIVKKHGEDKVLFGTDSPWKSQQVYVKEIERFNLSDSVKDKILYQNACKLLNLKGE